MRRVLWIVIVLVVAAGVWWYVKDKDTTTNTPANVNVTVSQPTANATIASPLMVSGQAVGNWYFEASFPIKLLDGSNQVIGQTVAQAQSDWMTTSMVPFTANLTFPAQPAGSQGTLVFEKDNPSGLPQNDDSYSIDVTF